MYREKRGKRARSLRIFPAKRSAAVRSGRQDSAKGAFNSSKTIDPHEAGAHSVKQLSVRRAADPPVVVADDSGADCATKRRLTTIYRIVSG